MKKNIFPIMIAALIIAQIVSIQKVSVLQSQIESARFEISNLKNNTRNEISAIYANVDEMLKKEASLIEIASTELGALDVNTLTVPVSFSITPKEVSEHTAVSLEIDGEQIPMNRNGVTFIATINRSIFQSSSPLIVMDENGVKKTTQDDRIILWSLKDAFLPTMHPQFTGESSYGSGTYNCKKTLHADAKNAQSGIVFTEMRLVIKVDEKVISDEVLPADISSGWQLDKTISLNDGQTCIMTVIATDSIDLEHHYTVDHFVGGADAQREPWFDGEQIYSADGKLLWELE